MAHYGYLEIEASRQGQIESELVKSGLEGAIQFYAYRHDVGVAKDDSGRGIVGSLPIHNAIVITKEVDATSPLLMKALSTSEMIQKALLTWQSFQDGKERTFFRIELRDAVITSIVTGNDDVRSNEKEQFIISEQVAIRYGAIRWEYFAADRVRSYEVQLTRKD